MSRTYRKLPYRYTRHRRGRRAALQRGDRSIPPDYDTCFDNESLRPWDVMYALIDRGTSVRGAVDRVCGRFHLPTSRKQELSEAGERRFQRLTTRAK